MEDSIIGLVVNIISLILATYLSIVGQRKKKLKIAVWLITGFITLGNIIIFIEDANKEEVYFDILTPHYECKEALEILTQAYQEELANLELIDIIGSYYICLKKPETFFYRFPEWIFLFRDPNKKDLYEFRVTDGRLPSLPEIELPEVQNLNEGHIAQLMTFKVSLKYLGIENPLNIERASAVNIMDEEGKQLIFMTGSAPEDHIEEVEESINTKVFVRVRTVGRPTDYVRDMRVIENPKKLGKTIITYNLFKRNKFYDSLLPIKNWTVDIEVAIRNAINNGAHAIPPGKTGIGGGPGICRMYNAKRYNLVGTFWDIPYKIGIRPILIDAHNGNVYAINNSGEYSTEWEDQLFIK